MSTNRYPPGPKAGFLGLGLMSRLKRAPLDALMEFGRTCGDIGYVRMGPVRYYFVNQPELIREVLVTKGKSFQKEGRPKRVFQQVDGNGLIVSEGEFWLRQRRLVQKAFGPQRMAHYAGIVAAYTGRMLGRWPGQTVVNMADEMTHLTLAIIAKAMFDVEVGGRAAELGAAVHALSEAFTREMAAAVFLPDWLPLPGKRRKREALRMLDQLIWGIIRERRASGEDKGDFLSMLLLAVDEEGDGRGMTDPQARDEAMTLFNAGHDTTASGLAWTWYLIAKHPEVEAKLVEEVERVLGDREATFEDAAELRYTEMVVKESLRLYPPAWLLFVRQPLADVELGGYRIAKGSWVAMSPYVTQRDPRFFENPERFDPERFAPGRVERIPQYAYFPFGGGPHVCIGNAFALLEMKLIVATVLQRCRLALMAGQREVEPEALLSLRPKGGLRMAVERRALVGVGRP